MKNAIIGTILFITLCAGTDALSQDLIVTNKNDSIKCKITNVKTDLIYFTFINDQGRIMNTLLPMSKILEYKYNYFFRSESNISPTKIVGNKNYPHLRIGLGGGFSYLTAPVSNNIPSELESYIKELKSGYNISVDAGYFLSKTYGLGLAYSLFKTNNSADIYGEDANGNLITGKLIDNIAVNYFGPSFLIRFMNKHYTNAFIMSFSLGYLGYENQATLFDEFLMNGSTFGITISANYDVSLGNGLALGFQLAYLGGSLSKYTIKSGNISQTIELSEGNYESLSRLDLNIALRFVK